MTAKTPAFRGHFAHAALFYRWRRKYLDAPVPVIVDAVANTHHTSPEGSTVAVYLRLPEAA